MSRRLTTSLALVALGLCAVGVLLIVEIIRPFHDLAIDGPLALLCWGTGALLSLGCFFMRGRSLILPALSFALNVLPLLGAVIMWWLMSHSNFAWH